MQQILSPIHVGNGQFEVLPNSRRIEIRCTHDFVVFGSDDNGELACILGPASGQDRLLGWNVKPGVKSLLIETAETGQWQITAFKTAGPEVLDDTPMEIPVNATAGDPIREMIRNYIDQELGRRAADQGFETPEEADDFDTGEDAEFISPYEMTEMQEERPLEPEEREQLDDGPEKPADAQRDPPVPSPPESEDASQ